MINKRQILFFKIANLVIKLIIHPVVGYPDMLETRKTIYKLIVNKYKEYLVNTSDEKVDIIINFRWQDYKLINNINETKYYVLFFRRNGKEYIYYYPNSIPQFQAMLICILTNELPKKDTFLLHASSLIKKEKAEIFLGPSGSGKSTLVSLVRENYQPLSWDVVIIEKKNSQFFVYQTPFYEKEGRLISDRSGRLINRWFFVRKSHKFLIKKINSKKKIFNLLKKQLYFNPKDKKIVECFLNELINAHLKRFFEIHFAKNRKKLIKLLT